MAERNQEDPKSAGARASATATTTKTWKVFNRPDAASAAAWLNTPPAQGAGEGFATTRPDGTLDVFGYF